MATYYVFSGAGGTNAGTSWTNAYTAFGSAVTAASADGDIILVHYLHQEEISVDTTYTFGNNVTVVSVNKDSSDAPTVMGTGGWIGNSTTNRYVAFAGADRRVRIWGITVRISGTTLDDVRFGVTSSGVNMEFEQCYFWNGNTGTGNAYQVGVGNFGLFRFIDCTWRFGATGQSMQLIGGAEIIGGSISSAGSTPTTLIVGGVLGGKTQTIFRGVDLSLITGTLVANIEGRTEITFDRCKLGTGVTVMASQTSNPTEDSANVRVLDCNSDDNNVFTGYYNALGSAVTDTGIYYTTSAAAQSWKIVTTANVKPSMPFKTPWISVYNSTLSAVSPRLEILRDGSTTAFTDAEVWAECLAKTTSGVPIATFSSDRATVLAAGTNQAAGDGLGSWTGESGTAWSGKIQVASLTPAEAGHISMRACVTAASTTLYVDPVVRTA